MMKRLMFWLMAAALLPMTAAAQDVTDDYRPMVVEGRTWHYDYEYTRWKFYDEDGEEVGEDDDYAWTEEVEHVTGTFSVSFERDTMVAGRPGKVSVVRFDNGRVKADATYYEEDRRVYRIELGETTPRLLFDFNLTVSDIGINGRCRLVDTLTVAGMDMRRICLFNGLSSVKRFGISYTWVEGIGCDRVGILDNELDVVSGFPAETFYKTFAKCDYDTGVTITPRELMVSAVDKPMRYPLLENGKKWICREKLADEDAFHTVTYSIVGDTIVSGEQFCKIYGEKDGVKTYLAAAKEMFGRTFVVLAGKRYEELFYDFYVGAGDELFVYASCGKPFSFEMSLLSLEEREMGGRKLHVYDLLNYSTHLYASLDDSSDNKSVRTTWIEGVGSLFGFFCTSLPKGPGAGGYDAGEHVLEKCLLADGTVLYDEGWVADEIQMSVNSGITKSTATYDLQGRRVADTTKPGVYVRNGKKVVIK